MRTVAHLSDLHFGRVDTQLLDPLRRRIAAMKPDLVVISGDLTQRAKPEEFREARRFLDTLPQPQIVVPGNHDVPLYNVFQRAFTPLSKYKRYISTDLEPAYIDDEIAVIGINTARSLVFKGGRINQEQVESARAKLCNLDERIIRMVVTHHPFDLPADWHDKHIVGRANMAMQMLARCGADVLLAGHVHMSHAGDTAARYKMEGYAALVVQAGTATSTRGRGETNAFNALRVDGREVQVERYAWDEAAADFTPGGTQRFKHGPTGWVRDESTAQPRESRPSR
jgi:3',5'-cyclic AMP phosphodiesterase CpdA